MVDNAFQKARMSTANRTEREKNKYVGLISTVMGLFTHKDGDLFSYFDKIDKTRDETGNTLLKQIPINNHTKMTTNVILPLEHIFGLCKTFKKF